MHKTPLELSLYFDWIVTIGIRQSTQLQLTSFRYCVRVCPSQGPFDCGLADRVCVKIPTATRLFNASEEE